MKLSYAIPIVGVALLLAFIDPVLLGAFVFGVPVIIGVAYLFERLIGPKNKNM